MKKFESDGNLQKAGSILTKQFKTLIDDMINNKPYFEINDGENDNKLWNKSFAWIKKEYNLSDK